MNELFREFAQASSRILGHAWAFIAAVLLIAAWIITGPIYGFSDTWQLVINTGTTIVTFLMVFLIQNTQNRDATAIHLKLDELIRAIKGARNSLVDLEDLSDEQLETLHKEFANLRKSAKHAHTTELIASELDHRHSKRPRDGRESNSKPNHRGGQRRAG